MHIVTWQVVGLAGAEEGVRVGFLVGLKEELPELPGGGDRCVGDEELSGTQRTN